MSENIDQLKATLQKEVESKTKFFFHSVKMAKYDVPCFSESSQTNKNYVFYGYDNLYPNYLMKLATQSAIHSSIIESISDLVAGDGFNWTLDGKTITDKKLLKYIQSFEAKANATESLQSIVQKMALDQTIFNAMSLQIIADKGKNHIAEIYHTDTSAIRAGKANSKGKIEKYFYSNDWNYVDKNGVDGTFYAFDSSKLLAKSLLYVKPYRPGNLYYSVPKYSGAINYINLDWEISIFYLAAIKNGLTPGLIASFLDGIPETEEQKDEIVANINKNYQGAENTNKAIVTFSESKETAPEFTVLQNSDIDKQWTVLQNQVMQNILVAHRITSPLLVGIKTEGQLGGNTELMAASELFHNKVIRPKQIMIEEILEKVVFVNTGKKVECTINNIEAVKFTLSDNILQNILTKDELRELIGYDPLVVVPPDSDASQSTEEVPPIEDKSKTSEDGSSETTTN